MANRPDDTDDADEMFDDDMFTQRERYGAGRGGSSQRPRVVSEFVRKAIENTVGSVTKSGDLSREALNYVLQQGDKGKREVVRIVAQEVGEFLRGIDLSSEVIKVLSNLQVDVNASIRFKQAKDGAIKPEILGDTNVSVVKDPSQPPHEVEDEPTQPPPSAPPAASEPAKPAPSDKPAKPPSETT